MNCTCTDGACGGYHWGDMRARPVPSAPCQHPATVKVRSLEDGTTLEMCAPCGVAMHETGLWEIES